MNDKRILVTGANGAMAKETIKHLLKDGYTNIVMACRTIVKGNVAKQEILKSLNQTQNSALKVVGGFDMNDPSSIAMAIEKLDKKQRFDIVFLAAGFAVFADDYQTITYNGKTVEKTIFQNLIGSHITWKLLKQNNLVNQNARVVIAGGEGARGIKGMIDKPEFVSSEEFKEYVYANFTTCSKYNPMNAIGISKFCGALWVQKMAKIESGNYNFIWFSPGLTSGSDGLKKLPTAKRLIFKLMFKVMSAMGKSQTPEKGGRKFADCIQGKIGENGDILGAPAGKTLGKITDQIPMNPIMGDQEYINEFWSIIEDVAGEYY